MQFYSIRTLYETQIFLCKIVKDINDGQSHTTNYAEIMIRDIIILIM